MDHQIKCQIQRILDIYPKWIQNLVKQLIEFIPRDRILLNAKLEGSYDPETGHIILWNPKIADDRELLVILSHEIGHKLFQEILNDNERKEWFSTIDAENIDCSIKESYPPRKYLEEHYCWIFSAWSYVLFLKRSGNMNKMNRFLNNMKKEYPLETKIVSEHLRKRKRVSNNYLSSSKNNIYHSQVVAFLNWIKSVLKET